MATALTQKVNQEGQRPTYAQQTDISFIEWVAGDLIRQAARRALDTKVEALRPAIERAVEEALRASIKPAAKALTQTFIDAAKNRYSMVVNLTFRPPEPR